MILPNNGRILIIDDNFNEAMPLIQMLSKKDIAYLYFDGKQSNMPTTPLIGVRVVFLDLRFGSYNDVKSVVSNAIAILKSLLSPKNGPYILITWSKHENDYAEPLKKALHSELDICPEITLQLSKSDYFEDATNASTFEVDIHRIISAHLGEDVENDNVVAEISNLLMGTSYFGTKVLKDGALKNIEDKLIEELKKANLISFFILWENTIGKATINTVNEIYIQMPNTIPKNEILSAMLHYMAKYALEKQMKNYKLDTSTLFQGSLVTLNEMFGYFCQDEMLDFNFKLIPELDKIEEKHFRAEAESKYRKWVVTFKPPERALPGNIYIDENRSFRPHELLSNKDGKYDAFCKEFLENKKILHIFAEISADCDIAQDKRLVSKIVYGVLIPENIYTDMKKDDKIKSGKLKEYLVDLGIIELDIQNSDGSIESKSMAVVFNLNLSTYSDVPSTRPLFALRKSFVVNLQTEIGKLISRQGIAMF